LLIQKIVAAFLLLAIYVFRTYFDMLIKTC